MLSMFFSTQKQDRPTLNKLYWQLYSFVAYYGREKKATAAVTYYTAEDNTPHCQWKKKKKKERWI